jgi:putative ABC transport system permease protein
VRRLSSLAWRSLRARPLRSFLTIAGVALGVAVLYASLAAGAAIDAAVDRAAADELGRAALRVEALEERGLSGDTLEIVAAAPGVGVAAPALERRTYLAAGLDRAPAGSLPAPVTVLGVDPILELELHDMPLSGGRLLVASDTNSALVAATLAQQEGLRIGDTLTLNGAADPGPQDFTIVGILSGDGYLPRAGGRLVVVPLVAAQALFDTGGISRIDLGLRAGSSVDEVSGQLEASIDTQPYLLVRASDTATSLRSGTAGLRATLLLVAAVVLFAGAFLIFNTLSMTVSERTREVGLLRAAGTTRPQVMLLMLWQALALGAAGSLLGVVAGSGAAALTLSWVGSTGSIALGGPDLSPGPVAMALAIGVLVTLAASLEPAWRASRITPMEALRRGPAGAAAGVARLRWLVLVFAVLALAALAVWPRGMGVASDGSSAGGIAVVGSGMWGPLVVYGLLLAAVLLVSRLLGPLLRLAGIPFGLFRTQVRLARSSLGRDPSRTALTAGALMIGLAMVVALGTAAQNVRRIGQGWLAETIPGSELLTSIRPIAPDGEILGQLSEMPGVKSVSPIGLFGVPWQDAPGEPAVRQEAAAIVGADYAADGRLVFVEGGGDPATAFAALDVGGSVIVPESLAAEYGLHLGDLMTFQTGARPKELRIVGIAAHTIPGDSQEAIMVGWTDAIEAFGAGGADFYAVRYEPGREASAQPQVDAAARSYALEPADLSRIRGTVGDALDRLFRLLDAMALVAVVVAGLGMVNTLSMSVLERVREIGVLRATGMSSRQVWGMVVIEAGVLGVASAFVGAMVGFGVGALLVVWSSSGLAVGFDPPWLSIGLAVLFGVLISVAAAVYPAGIASRQSIVQALQHE